ncbi:hypothetical protein LTR17_006482 [Elasticomyces elasticus]|nr:hypothetical protein LTR17_006482 [Elasticomyces elasticus]
MATSISRKESRMAIAQSGGGLDATTSMIDPNGSLAKYRHGPVNPWAPVLTPSPVRRKKLKAMAGTYAQIQCPLFRIPAEVRNYIYALAFHNGDIPNQKAKVHDLLAAEPPSKSLLLCSRKIYREARGIFLDAYAAYWSDTTFVLDERDSMDYDFHAPFTDEDLSHIQTLYFLTSSQNLCDGRIKDNGHGLMDILKKADCEELEFMRCRDGSWWCLNFSFVQAPDHEMRNLVLMPGCKCANCARPGRAKAFVAVASGQPNPDVWRGYQVRGGSGEREVGLRQRGMGVQYLAVETIQLLPWEEKYGYGNGLGWR